MLRNTYVDPSYQETATQTSFKASHSDIFKEEPLPEDSQEQPFYKKCNYETCHEAQQHLTSLINERIKEQTATEKQ